MCQISQIVRESQFNLHRGEEVGIGGVFFQINIFEETLHEVSNLLQELLYINMWALDKI